MPTVSDGAVSVLTIYSYFRYIQVQFADDISVLLPISLTDSLTKSEEELEKCQQRLCSQETIYN